MNHLVQKILLKLEEEAIHDRKVWNTSAPGHYRGSEIGYCARATQYRALGFTPEPQSGEILALFADGHLHEDSVRNLFKKIGTVSNVQTNISKKYEHKGHVLYGTGTLDFLFNNSIVVDVKGITTFKFKYLDKNWPQDYEAYIMQVTLYMDILGLEDAIVAVKNKDNSELNFKHVEYSEFMMNRILDKMVKIHEGIINRKLISRPYNRTTSHCKYCDFRKQCWRMPRDKRQWQARKEGVEDDLQLKLRASLDKSAKRKSRLK